MSGRETAHSYPMGDLAELEGLVTEGPSMAPLFADWLYDHNDPRSALLRLWVDCYGGDRLMSQSEVYKKYGRGYYGLSRQTRRISGNSIIGEKLVIYAKLRGQSIGQLLSYVLLAKRILLGEELPALQGYPDKELIHCCYMLYLKKMRLVTYMFVPKRYYDLRPITASVTRRIDKASQFSNYFNLVEYFGHRYIDHYNYCIDKFVSWWSIQTQFPRLSKLPCYLQQPTCK